MTLFAVVPVKDRAGTKSRLKPVLDETERAGLTVYMMENVLSALGMRVLVTDAVMHDGPDRQRLAEEILGFCSDLVVL